MTSTADSQRPYGRHRPIADACRANPGEWVKVRTYKGLATATTIASNIRRGGYDDYSPRGSFESEVRGGRTVWARYSGPPPTFATDLDRARAIAVTLEQENARLLTIIGHLAIRTVGAYGASDSDLEELRDRVEITEHAGLTHITIRETQ